MRCLIAGLGAVLALLLFILNIGGLDLLKDVATSWFSTPEGWMILSIPVIAAFIGCFLTRLNHWLVLLTGALIGLAGAWAILILIMSQI